MGDAPFPLKSALKVTYPFEKRRLRPISTYKVSNVRDSEESSVTTNMKSTMHFPTSYRWSAHSHTARQRASPHRPHVDVRYVNGSLPLSPKGWLKKRFFRFLNKSQFQSNTVCYKVSLYENFQQQSCSTTISLSNGP